MEDLDAPKPARGRPRDPAKRLALLDAARDLFLEHGFDAVTMDHVVARSGISRATLWSSFADKTALLEAVIAAESERMIAREWVGDQPGAGAEDRLASFGHALLRFIYDPAVISFERLVVGASRSHPQLRPRFFAAGPGRQFTILTDLIREGQAEGLLVPGDVEQAASDLVGLWQGFRQVQAVYGQTPLPHGAELERRARHGLQQFLRLYGREENSGSTA